MSDFDIAFIILLICSILVVVTPTNTKLNTLTSTRGKLLTRYVLLGYMLPNSRIQCPLLVLRYSQFLKIPNPLDYNDPFLVKKITSSYHWRESFQIEISSLRLGFAFYRI